METQSPPQKTNEQVDLFAANVVFSRLVSLEVYYTSVKHITAPNASFALHVAPFDAETPLHLCVKDKSLGAALQMCATLLNGQWREEQTEEKVADATSQTAYVLEPKPDAVEREKAFYNATLDLNAEPLAEVARLVSRHSANYWQKEYEKIRSVRPTIAEPKPEKAFAQYLARPDKQSQGFFGVFAGLTRSQRRILTNDGHLVLPWNQMNATQQQNALAALHTEKRANPNSVYDYTPEENRKVEAQERATAQQYGVVPSVSRNPVSGRVTKCGLGVGKPHGGIPIPNAGTTEFLLPVRGNPYLFDLEANTAASMDKPADHNAKPKAEPSNDTLLENVSFPRGIRFTKNDTWAEVVQTLARELSFSLVSDAYTAARCCLYPLPKNGATIDDNLDTMTVAQALDALCRAYNYLWWYEPAKNDAPGTLFFRSRAWFVEKRYEPPASVIAKASAVLQSVPKRRESVAIVDCMVGLTIEQLQGIAGRRLASNYGSGPGFDSRALIGYMEGWGAACSAFYWLRFWSRLSPEQKQKMKSPDGLLGKQLSAVQQNELLQNLFASSALPFPPSETAAYWEKVKLRVGYEESQVEDFPPENAPQWKPNDLRPASLTFSIQSAEIASGSWLALPVALAPPPQPQKPTTAKA